MLSSVESSLWMTWPITLCRHGRCITCVFSDNTSYVSLISSIHKSYPVPQRAIIICCVLTLEGNRRWPLRFYHSLDWVLGQQYHLNWIIWNHKHLFLALWLWTVAGWLPLDSIKHTYRCYYGPSVLHAGMSGSCASTQTIKVNKNSRWVRTLQHKWVPVILLWTTCSTGVRNYQSQVFLQLKG